MHWKRTLRMAGAALAILALAAFSAACDDEESAGDATSTEPAATQPAGTEPDATSTQAADETPAAEALEIEAENVAFSTDALEAPANQAFSVVFNNRDDGISHTFSIYESQAAVDANEDPLATTGQVLGPAEETLNVPALEAGEYYFQCDVHSTMNGTLTVQ